MTDNTNTKAHQEHEEAKHLANEGFIFTAGRFTTHVRPLCFGTIARANRYASELRLNILSDDPAQLYNDITKNQKSLMMFIAICLLNNPLKIQFMARPLAKYLKWHLTPEKAYKLSVLLLQMYDLTNFITSIRLLGTTTVTQPTKTELIDGKQPVLNQFTA